jgi:hypothetical protein
VTPRDERNDDRDDVRAAAAAAFFFQRGNVPRRDLVSRRRR